MLQLTGRTLTGFASLINEARAVRGAEVDFHSQSAVDKHIAKIDRLLRELPEWVNWFPDRGSLQGLVDMLTYERKYALKKAKDARTADKAKEQVA